MITKTGKTTVHDPNFEPSCKRKDPPNLTGNFIVCFALIKEDSLPTSSLSPLLFFHSTNSVPMLKSPRLSLYLAKITLFTLYEFFSLPLPLSLAFRRILAAASGTLESFFSFPRMGPGLQDLYRHGSHHTNCQLNLNSSGRSRFPSPRSGPAFLLGPCVHEHTREVDYIVTL